MNRKQALMVLAACLAVATVLLAYYTVRTVAYREFEMIYYEAEEIDHSDVAWTLEDPDSYILEAISRADDENHYLVRAHRNETDFIDQVREHGTVWDIVYNGTYYYVLCWGSCDPHPRPGWWGTPKIYLINDRREVETRVAAAGISLGAVWVVWILGWRRNE